jgi:DNA-binding response OmpR family regulator
MFEMPSGGFLLIDRFSRNEGMPLSDEGDSIEPQRSLPTIIVVDDERRIADTLTEILEMAGFRVATAYDGWEALRVAARFRPDYVLSDVLMPRMNGVNLAIAMRKIYPDARILLFSGQAGISEILLDGLRQGFEFELIAKPIHPLKLIERLKAQ